MASLDLSKPITTEVLTSHWPSVKHLIRAAALKISADNEVSQNDVAKAIMFETLKAALSDMGIQTSVDVLQEKADDIHDIWRQAQRALEPDSNAPQSRHAESIRFQSDRFRYQKEARQYYKDPRSTFPLELMQNSMDAMAKLGPSHRMKIMASVEDVLVSGASRVKVSFQDNGVGMNKDVVKNGLLRVGATSGTRSDSGAKNKLTEAAGGFGLAKVLLYLSQGGFQLWTKMKDEEGCFIRAEFGREDPEICEVKPMTNSDVVKRFGETFSSGTRVEILLDPWVMRDCLSYSFGSTTPNDAFYANSRQHRKADSFVQEFKSQWSLCNLPIDFYLEEPDGTSKVELSHDIGKFSGFLHLSGSRLGSEDKRRFAALYTKTRIDEQASKTRVRVFLQVLQSRLPNEHDYRKDAGHFLYLFDIDHFRYQKSLSKRVDISIVLFTMDQHQRPFEVSELLKGTRDALEYRAHTVIVKKIQKYILDPHAVKQAKAEAHAKCFKSHANVSFSEWLQRTLNPPPNHKKPKTSAPKRNPQWWQNVTKAQVNKHYGGCSWREKTEYNFYIYRDVGIEDNDVPDHLKTRESIRPVDMMWMELFGGFVSEAMRVFRPELEEKRRPTSFDLGFVVGDESFAQPVLPKSAKEADADSDSDREADADSDEELREACQHIKEEMGCMEEHFDEDSEIDASEQEQGETGEEESVKDRDKPLFLFNHKFVKGLEEASETADVTQVMRGAIYVKGMAVREVAYLLEGGISGPDFYERIQECMVRFEEASMSSSWSWFSWYKQRVSERYLREVQEGTKDKRLMKHVVALQEPTNEDVSREYLHCEHVRLKRENEELKASQSSPATKKVRVKR